MLRHVRGISGRQRTRGQHGAEQGMQSERGLKLCRGSILPCAMPVCAAAAAMGRLRRESQHLYM